MNKPIPLLLQALLKLISYLPLWAIHFLGCITGMLLWAFPNQLKHAAKVNLWACFPKLDRATKQKLLRKTLIHTGKALWEIPYIWFGPPERTLNKVIKVDGFDEFKAAHDSGTGVIALVPHFGAWEAASIFGAKHFKTHTLFKPPKQAMLFELVKSAREKFNTRLFPTTPQGVKALYKALRKGYAACILPDHDPRKNGGEFAPFFGIDAMTMTLGTKLAEKTKAPAFMVYAKRLPWARGFHMVFSPLSNSQLGDTDSTKALHYLNLAIEQCIVREGIEQYTWTYRRFKTRPPGEAPFY